MEINPLNKATDSALRFTKRDLEPPPKVQPYQEMLLRMMATIPSGCELKSIWQGGRGYYFATPNGLTMTHRWDGRDWTLNAQDDSQSPAKIL